MTIAEVTDKVVGVLCSTSLPTFVQTFGRSGVLIVGSSAGVTAEIRIAETIPGSFSVMGFAKAKDERRCGQAIGVVNVAEIVLRDDAIAFFAMYAYDEDGTILKEKEVAR